MQSKIVKTTGISFRVDVEQPSASVAEELIKIRSVKLFHFFFNS